MEEGLRFASVGWQTSAPELSQILKIAFYRPVLTWQSGGVSKPQFGGSFPPGLPRSRVHDTSVDTKAHAGSRSDNGEARSLRSSAVIRLAWPVLTSRYPGGVASLDRGCRRASVSRQS